MGVIIHIAAFLPTTGLRGLILFCSRRVTSSTKKLDIVHCVSYSHIKTIVS
jgi:hypothetical protein